MVDIISDSRVSKQDLQPRRKDWFLIAGVGLSLLSLTYLVASAQMRYAGAAHPGVRAESFWLPLELFIVATSPALAGYIFLWSERHLESRSTQKLLRNVGVFGIGLVLAGFVAALIK
jgi:hypothetical protein